MNMSREHCWYDSASAKGQYFEKNVPNAILCVTDPTLTNPVPNPGLRLFQTESHSGQLTAWMTDY